MKFSFIMLTVWRNSMPMDSFLSKEKCTGIFKCLARNNSTSKQEEIEVHFLAVILTSTQPLYFFLMMYVYAFSKLLLLCLFTYLCKRKHSRWCPIPTLVQSSKIVNLDQIGYTTTESVIFWLHLCQNRQFILVYFLLIYHHLPPGNHCQLIYHLGIYQ